MNLEKLKAEEDEALALTENWKPSYRLLVYEILNRRWGCVMDHIEDNRIREFQKEEKASS